MSNQEYLNKLKEIKVGDNIEIKSGRSSFGKESKVVKITKTQIHVEFKNGDAKANGDIWKFRLSDGTCLGDLKYHEKYIVPIEE